MSPPVVTSILYNTPMDAMKVNAEVIGADRIATTYVLNCDLDQEPMTQCGFYNYTVILGPWASKTLPPGAASTGNFDFHLNYPDDVHPFEFSAHCEMSRTVAKKCTTINIGGNNDGTPTATYTSPHPFFSGFGYDNFTWSPITVTAGQDLLTATHTASNKATVDADAAQNTQATSGESSTSSSTKSSSASSCLTRIFTAISVAGAAISIVLS